VKPSFGAGKLADIVRKSKASSGGKGGGRPERGGFIKMSIEGRQLPSHNPTG